jgi:hypothetical protein
MSAPAVVYLDSQDYSRFGDALRGKSDIATQELFRTLEARRHSGAAIFAVSMPILGELLQYNSSYRETTFKKAEAVERLCGSWALAYPSRLVAAEIADAAFQLGFLSTPRQVPLLSSDRYWFPNVGDELRHFRARLRAEFEAEAATIQLNSRTLRRRMKKQVRKFDPVAAARGAAPMMAAEYGIPVEAITGSILSFLQGKIPPEEASRRLFSAIAAPTTFVGAYFEKVETDRSELPAWMSQVGAGFEARFIELRQRCEPLLKYDQGRESLTAMLEAWPRRIGHSVLRMGADDAREFAVDETLFDRLTSLPEVVDTVPSCGIVGRALTEYVRQLLGFRGTQAAIERSFGGDLVHALYLPHVDLWRGDRRFSSVMKAAAPQFADRIVASLKELPAAIDAWHAAQIEKAGRGVSC